AGSEVATTALARSTFKPISTSSRSGSIAVFTRSMRSGHCWGSAGRRWLRRMTGCTPVHRNIQNAAAKAWRASSELGYRQNRHQIWCSWVSTGQACVILFVFIGIGQIVLEALGINLASFRIAGGLVLLIIALRMVLQEAHDPRT